MKVEVGGTILTGEYAPHLPDALTIQPWTQGQIALKILGNQIRVDRETLIRAIAAVLPENGVRDV